MSPYRTLPPAPRLAPRTPWHRLAWAFHRGVLWQLWRRRSEQIRLIESALDEWSPHARWLCRKYWQHGFEAPPAVYVRLALERYALGDDVEVAAGK